MIMKHRIFMVAVAMMCIASLNVNAQTEETETSSQRYLRLSKIADENPTDWKAQLEIAHVLLDKSSGFYNQQRGARYYERIYNMAFSYNINKEIPDSVLTESCIMMMTAALDRKDIDKVMFYADEMKHAQKVGLDVKDDMLNMCDMYALMINMGKENELGTLVNIMDLRERITKKGLPGIEHTDMMTAMFFDNVVELGKDMFGDKLLEITLDGKKYIFLSLGDWNIEKPLAGWTSTIRNSRKGKDEKDDKETNPTLAYGEDGVVYDKLEHGKSMEFSFFCNKEGVVPKGDVNTRLITVTPERRQELIQAYRGYMKKASKEKKKNKK